MIPALIVVCFLLALLLLRVLGVNAGNVRTIRQLRDDRADRMLRIAGLEQQLEEAERGALAAGVRMMAERAAARPAERQDAVAGEIVVEIE